MSDKPKWHLNSETRIQISSSLYCSKLDHQIYVAKFVVRNENIIVKIGKVKYYKDHYRYTYIYIKPDEKVVDPDTSDEEVNSFD